MCAHMHMMRARTLFAQMFLRGACNIPVGSMGTRDACAGARSLDTGTLTLEQEMPEVLNVLVSNQL